MIHQRDGVTLSTPTYRFTIGKSARVDDPEIVIVDIPAFQKLREDEYFVPMEIGINAGGSGWFSLIGFGIIHPSRRTIGPTFGIHAGDRCNDGYAEFAGIKRDPRGQGTRAFQYRTAMTPFRLLNPTDQTDWRMLGVARSLAGDEKDKKFPVPRSLNDWRVVLKKVEAGCKAKN